MPYAENMEYPVPGMGLVRSWIRGLQGRQYHNSLGERVFAWACKADGSKEEGM